MGVFGSLFSGMFRRFLTDNPPFYPLYSNYLYNQKAPILIDLNDLMDVYLAVPHLRAVIDRKAEMYKNMMVRLKDKRTGEWIESHPVLDLLKNPNPLQKQEDFLANLSINRDIYASAFIYKLKAFSNSDPKVLWHLPPQLVKIIPTGKMFQQTDIKQIIKGYELTITDDEEKSKFETDDVIRFASGISNNPLKPESKFWGLRNNISNIDGALKTRNVIIHDRGALGILSSSTKDTDGSIPLGSEERKRIEAEYRDKQRGYGITDEQKKIIITNASLSWSPMSYPTKDLMLFEEIEDDFSAILSAYGMARDIFPSTKGATFENQKQALVQTYQNTIQPEADSDMRILSEELGLDDQGLELIADYSWLPVMQHDEESRERARKTKVETLMMLMSDGVIDRETIATECDVELAPEQTTGVDPMEGTDKTDSLGKIPLAIQQLALARERAMSVGDESLAQKLGDKIDELLQQI